MCKTLSPSDNSAGKIQASCSFCGRPVKRVLGRGRPREMHRNCSLIEARLNEIEWRLERVHWQDKSYIKSFRGELWSLIARAFNQPQYIKFAPGCDAENPAECEEDGILQRV